MSVVHYTVELVGGPFDGAPGLHWVDDGEHELPDGIWVGICRGNGACASVACRTSRRRHVAYWVEGIEEIPMETVEYRKEDAYLTDASLGSTVVAGVARYVCGAIDMFGTITERDAVPLGAAA